MITNYALSDKSVKKNVSDVRIIKYKAGVERISVSLTRCTQKGLFKKYTLSLFYNQGYKAMFDLMFAILLATDVYLFLIIFEGSSLYHLHSQLGK